MKLSADFSFAEFTRSQTAARRGIENQPPEDSIAAVRLLVEAVLQPARSHFGRPMNVSSGFRCEELNRAIGGSRTSQHVWTELYAAADVEIFGVDNLALARWIETSCEFDQLIAECYDPAKGPNAGWVHVSLRTDGANRTEVLTYRREHGYSRGLPA